MSQKQTINFTPVTITAETLQILSKQDNYLELAGLYIAYVEVATWQGNRSVYAANTFMAKRVGCGLNKIKTLRAALVALGLLETVRRTDDKNKVVGYYVKVNHYYGDSQWFNSGSTGSESQWFNFTTSGENDPQVLETSSLSTRDLQLQQVVDETNSGNPTEKPSIEAQPTDGPAIKLPLSSLNRTEPSGSQVDKTNQEISLDASAKQTNGGLTNQPKYDVEEKEQIKQLAQVLNDRFPEVKAGVIPQALQEVTFDELLVGARHYAKQFTADVENDYWRKAPGMKRVHLFMSPDKNGSMRYKTMIVAADAAKTRKKMF